MTILYRIEAIGNLVRSPELRYTPGGSAATVCTVAVNDSYKKNGEEVKRVAFWDVEFYGPMAEQVAARNYQKGDSMLFDGIPDISIYEKKDGGSGLRCKARFGRIVKLGAARNGNGDYKAAESIEDTEDPFEAIPEAAVAAPKVTDTAF